MLTKIKTRWMMLLPLASILTACTLPNQFENRSRNPITYADPIITTNVPMLGHDATISINELPQVSTFVLGQMTSQDYDALIAVSKHNEQKLFPLFSGISRELPIYPSLSFVEVHNQALLNGKALVIAKLKIPDAEMLRIQINLLDLPPDSEIFLNSRPGSQLNRWIPNPSLSEWSPIVFGDSVQLAIRSSQRIEKLNLLGVLQMFSLTRDGKLVQGKKAFINGRWEPLITVTNMGPLVDSSCKIDNNTKYRNLPNFVRQIESATGLLATVTSLPDKPIVVAGFCTGTRVASLRDPQGYYILAANHCFSTGNPPQANATQAAVSSTQVFWDYRTAACNTSGPVEFSSQQLSSLLNSGGSTLLGARFESDSVLFRVNPVTGTRVALGWQLGLQFTNDAFVHRVSHPSAYSTGYTLQLIDHVENLTYCEAIGLPRAEYFHSALLEGATSPGSSGSAVVTQNLRVVGQQYGLCKLTKNGYTWHIHVDGELSRSWPAFGSYLQ